MCKSSDYNGIYADIYEVFGEEITRKFHHHFKGHHIWGQSSNAKKEHPERPACER